MEKAKIGVVGLAVMGENLALNIESKGFAVAVFNRTGEKTKTFIEGKAKGKKIYPAYSMEELCSILDVPRKIILMVKAGQPVDDMIAQLKHHLSQGDLIIDGGNSFFKDTERRNKELREAGILYNITGVDAVTRATPLFKEAGMETYNYANLFWGNVPGCVGETSVIALLLVGLYLI